MHLSPVRQARPVRPLERPASPLPISLLISLSWVHAVVAQPPLPPDEAADPDENRPAVVQEEIVVSANLVESPASSVASSVTVLDQATIETFDKPFVVDLLRAIPGLEVTQTGAPGKVASVRLRGGEASQTLVLLDGVRLNSATTGAYNFANLETVNVERIEVLRGPQAIYGSEAVSGVISIVTARGRGELSGSASGEVGSRHLRRLGLSLGGQHRDYDYRLSGSDLSADGYSHRSERAGNRELDPYENRTLSGRLGRALGDDGHLDLTLRSTSGDTGLDGFPLDDPNASQATDELDAALGLRKQLASTWTQTLRLSLTAYDLLGTDPDTPFNNYEIDSRLVQLHSLSTVALSKDNTLTAGYDLEHREGTNLGSFDESVYLRSYFVENLWSWAERAIVSAALRRDEHSSFGGETTYRVTGALELPTGSTRLRGSLGTAFRAPNFNELYFPGAGNRQLSPETSRGFDLAVEQRLAGGRLRLDVAYFDIDFDSLIDFDLATFTFRNTVSARSQGLEASFDWRPSSRSRSRLSHTYNRTEDLASELPLARRPKHRTTALFEIEPSKRLRLATLFFVVRDRINSDGTPMDDYERLDLRLEYRIESRWRPYLRIDNVLDEDYEEVPGFTTPGAVVAGGLRLEF